MTIIASRQTPRVETMSVPSQTPAVSIKLVDSKISITSFNKYPIFSMSKKMIIKNRSQLCKGSVVATSTSRIPPKCLPNLGEYI